MSVSIDPKNGVRFKTVKKHGMSFTVMVVILEAVFSFFLYIAIAERIMTVAPAQGAAGVPQLIAYQGMLTDSSGNPLGGVGTTYCFRYSIYDDPSTGNQLWPASTPGNSTTTVVDGVFSDELGRVDSLSGLDFEATSTYYLQVQVNTATSTCTDSWENLTPRQQITSDGWSQTAENVYGPSIETTSTQVLIGNGVSKVTSSSLTMLTLDRFSLSAGEQVGGSCSTAGSMWYDSAMSRGLICESGIIQALSNASTTIAGIGTNASAPIGAGNVVFSNSNNVTFGQNGSTITASISVAASGGTLSQLEWPSGGASQTTLAMASNGAMSFVPFFIGQTLSVSKAYAVMSISALTNTSASTGSQSISIGLGIYTLNGNYSNGTLSSVSTGSSLYAYSYSSNASTASLNGVRRISIPITINATPGNYWYGVWVRTTTANVVSMSLSLFGAYPNANIYNGDFDSASATSNQYLPGLGLFSASTAAMPGSLGLASITEAGTAVDGKVPYIIFTNY